MPGSPGLRSQFLVVTDEIAIAAYLKRGLERDGGVVDVAAAVDAAFDAIADHSYAAVIIDEALEGSRGREMCEELRRRGWWDPIILLVESEGNEGDARTGPADEQVERVFAMSTVSSRLRRLVHQSRGERPPVIERGDIQVDGLQHQVRVKSREVRLTPTEFCVLELLARRRGDVVSREDILHACWDWTFDGDPNIVEVYIGQVRKKIDVPTTTTKIETIRGAGYRLVAGAT